MEKGLVRYVAEGFFIPGVTALRSYHIWKSRIEHQRLQNGRTKKMNLYSFLMSDEVAPAIVSLLGGLNMLVRDEASFMNALCVATLPLAKIAINISNYFKSSQDFGSGGWDSGNDEKPDSPRDSPDRYTPYYYESVKRHRQRMFEESLR